uniref:Uncharacterized protein n=1 Tax=Ditylenchus dipsaci TaxID=166011 RepID=A0A915ER73_9BILA
MYKQEAKIFDLKHNEKFAKKVERDLAIVLHAILHVAKLVEKPIVILALTGAAAGCMYAAVQFPVVLPILMVVIRNLVEVIYKLTKEVVYDTRKH